MDDPARKLFGNNKIGHVLNIKMKDGSTILDLIESAFHNGEKKSITERKNEELPQPWNVNIQLNSSSDLAVPLVVTIEGKWRLYKSKMEARLIDGVYVFTDNLFYGTQSSPCIDRFSSEPGPGWERIIDPPKRIQPNSIIIILYKGNFREKGHVNNCSQFHLNSPIANSHMPYFSPFRY